MLMPLVFRIVKRSPTCHLLLQHQLRYPPTRALYTALRRVTAKAPIHLSTHPRIPSHRCSMLIGPSLRLNIHLNMIYRHFGLQHPSSTMNYLRLLRGIHMNLTAILKLLHLQLEGSGQFLHQFLACAARRVQGHTAHFGVHWLGQTELGRSKRPMMCGLSLNRQRRTELASFASKCSRRQTYLCFMIDFESDRSKVLVHVKYHTHTSSRPAREVLGTIYLTITLMLGLRHVINSKYPSLV